MYHSGSHWVESTWTLEALPPSGLMWGSKAFFCFSKLPSDSHIPRHACLVRHNALLQEPNYCSALSGTKSQNPTVWCYSPHAQNIVLMGPNLRCDLHGAVSPESPPLWSHWIAWTPVLVDLSFCIIFKFTEHLTRVSAHINADNRMTNSANFGKHLFKKMHPWVNGWQHLHFQSAQNLWTHDTTEKQNDKQWHAMRLVLCKQSQSHIMY